jgi:hypothetical protein
MNKPTMWHLAAVCLLVLALASGCGPDSESQPATGTQAAPQQPRSLTVQPSFTPLVPTVTEEAEDTPGVGTPSAPMALTPGGEVLTGETPLVGATPSAEPAAATGGGAQPAGETGAETDSDAELPKIYGFMISPRETEISGRVYMAWDARGDRAYICPKTYLGLIDHQCFNVPLIGSQYVTIHANDDTWDYYGYELHVVADGREVVEFLPISITCQGPGQWWFFRGDPYTTHVPEQCPVSYPLMSNGAAQRFEHGMMMWIEAIAQIIVFFEDGQYRSFSNLPAPSTPQPVGDTPPDGFFEPISGFGMLWRGEVPGTEDIRERLGWAVEQEFPTITAYQCYAEEDRLTCFVRGPEVQVIRLSPNGTWDIWETE